LKSTETSQRAEIVKHIERFQQFRLVEEH